MFVVYQIKRRSSGRSYVGLTSQKLSTRWSQHKSDAKRRPRHLISKAIRKHGPDAFDVSELAYFKTFEQAVIAERGFIDSLGTLCPKGYNLTSGGDGTPGTVKSLLTRKRIGKASANRTLEVREKISRSLRGRKLNLTFAQREILRSRVRAQRHTEETKAKLSAMRAGRRMPPLSPEKRAARKIKVQEKMNGRKYSITHRRRISIARMGMKFTDEHRANISKASAMRKHSPETIEKIRQANLGRRNSPESIERMRAAAQLRAVHQRSKKNAVGLPSPIAHPPQT